MSLLSPTAFEGWGYAETESAERVEEIAEAKSEGQKRGDQVKSGGKREPSLVIPIVERVDHRNLTTGMTFGAAGAAVKARNYRAADVSPYRRSEKW